MRQISEAALAKRISRKLAHEGLILRKNRDNSRWLHDLGYYYVVNSYFNRIEHPHVDLEAWGRDLGVLADNEALAS